MKRNSIGQMVIENEKDVQDIIDDKVDMNPDLDGEDGRDEVNEVCSPYDEVGDNWDEIKELRAALKSEHEYLRSLDVDSQMRLVTIDNMVRISDQIAALDI